MTKTRLEAFSDGVIAIIITIMVLELAVPHDPDIAALAPLAPTIFGYVLSFIFVGIYWNNHHHLLHTAARVDGRIMWANLHLLFWLSLVPFVTGWMGETHFATWPVAAYGFVLLMAAIAFTILVRSILGVHGPESLLATAIQKNVKGKISLALYAAALPPAFVHPWISCAIFVVVTLMWLVPDRRIERALAALEDSPKERDATGGAKVG